MANCESHKFASHTVWTYFPFGRLAKGLTKTINNPTMFAENMLGIPLHDVRIRNSRGNLKTSTPLVGEFWGGNDTEIPSGKGSTTPLRLVFPLRDYEHMSAVFERVGASLQSLLEQVGVAGQK